MNKAGLLGTILAASILGFAILESTKNPMVFADPHGIVIVIGGTLTVALLSFNFVKLFAALKVLVRKTLGSENDDYFGTIQLIVQLSEVYRVNPKNMLASVPEKAHPFLKDAVQMIVSYGFSAQELDEILSSAIRGKTKRNEEESRVWKTIARFPPAFGLLGATLGMISLLQTLGEPGSQERIGPAMAMALVATFYGLVCANLVLLPIAEKLNAVAIEDKNLRQIIKHGIILIVEKRHPTFIAEYLQSYLSPSMRASFSEDKETARAG
jgi:chemotaxis protein MotA